MRNLVVGAGGLLGGAFVRAFRRRGEFVATTGFGEGYTHYFELSYPEDIYQIMEDEQPERVFLCAYNAWVDAAEWDETVFQTNVSGNLHAALAAKFVGAKVYFPSSSYVFNGNWPYPYTEATSPAPINVYGRHKALLEELILENCPGAVVFRTVGLFGPEKEERKNFVYQVLDHIAEGKPYEVPSDQTMNPILSDNLVKAILDLPKEFSGLVHAAGDTYLSKFIWAKEIEGLVNSLPLAKPVYTKELEENLWGDRSQRAERPRNAMLDCGQLIGLIGYQPQMGLEGFINAIYPSSEASHGQRRN